MKGVDFIRIFKEKITQDSDIKKYYNPGKDSDKKLADYTKAMGRLIKSTLHEVNDADFDYSKKPSKDSYYTYNPEYFKIDYTSWNNTKIESYSDTGIKLYSWNFDFAIEHENDSKDWTYEVLKLSFIRADVRIVIGYVDKNNRDKELDIIQSQVNQFKYPVNNDEEYYVILMNTKLSAGAEPFEMKVYKIIDKKVEEA